jgi:hypothetical protein
VTRAGPKEAGTYKPFTSIFYFTTKQEKPNKSCSHEWFEHVNSYTSPTITWLGDYLKFDLFDWNATHDPSVFSKVHLRVEDWEAVFDLACKNKGRSFFLHTDYPGGETSGRPWDLFIFQRYCKSCARCQFECCCALIHVHMAPPAGPHKVAIKGPRCGSEAEDCRQPSVDEAVHAFGVYGFVDIWRDTFGSDSVGPGAGFWKGVRGFAASGRRLQHDPDNIWEKEPTGTTVDPKTNMRCKKEADADRRRADKARSR